MSLMCEAAARCVSCAYRKQAAAAVIASPLPVKPKPSSERTAKCLMSRLSESSNCQSQSSSGVSVVLGRNPSVSEGACIVSAEPALETAPSLTLGFPPDASGNGSVCGELSNPRRINGASDPGKDRKSVV